MVDYTSLQYWEMRDIIARIHLEVKRRNPIFVNAYINGLTDAYDDLEEISAAEEEHFTSEFGPKEKREG